ncbi:MAG: GTPase, partial [Alphaproteobacteria bacterium]
MQKTQNGLRKKIVFAGRTNAGKSSLINAIVGDHVSIVSDVKGTTTDTVKRAYEILGFGPVLLCDTAGFGDDTALGRAREQAATEAVKNADLVVLVIGDREMNAADKALIASLASMKIPYLIVYNKNDIFKRDIDDILIDTVTKTGVDLLVRKMAEILSEQPEKKLLDGIVKAGDKVLLVMPQDSSAPKGRLILPQVQMIRELLDIHALVSCVQTEEVVTSYQAGEYDLIITDSKVIKEVLSVVPSAQRVSTFSVLFARSKGNFEAFLRGV